MCCLVFCELTVLFIVVVVLGGRGWGGPAPVLVGVDIHFSSFYMVHDKQDRFTLHVRRALSATSLRKAK